VRLVYEPQPRPRAIAALAGETVVKVACGTNHTGACYSFLDLGYMLLFTTFPLMILCFGYLVAVDKNGYVYT